MEVEALGGPERAGYGYENTATDNAATEEGIPADAHADVVWETETWTVKVDDTASWPTDGALAYDTEAPAKDNFEEEATGRTAGADGLFGALAAAAGGGGRVAGSRGKAVAGFRLFVLDHTTNNAAT